MTRRSRSLHPYSAALREDFLLACSGTSMRVFANPSRCPRGLDKSYSRTVRWASYRERAVAVSKARPPNARAASLADLAIRPKGDPGVRPQKPRRAGQGADLMLNAATLNTGHAWQYTASFMGERRTPSTRMSTAPTACAGSTTKTLRRPTDRSDRPGRGRSACVPGLFEPIRLDGLYDAASAARRRHRSLCDRSTAVCTTTKGSRVCSSRTAASSW